MEKFKKALDLEKKAYTVDFKKGLDTYLEDPNLSPHFTNIL